MNHTITYMTAWSYYSQYLKHYIKLDINDIYKWQEIQLKLVNL